MAEGLVNGKCVPCKGGEPRVTAEEMTDLLPEIPSWNVVEEDGVKHLERVFSFPNFVHALAFTNQIGLLAEAEQHHPQILTEWGKVTVRWWTHKIRGLHKNDFIMAAKTDQAFTAAMA